MSLFGSSLNLWNAGNSIEAALKGDRKHFIQQHLKNAHQYLLFVQSRNLVNVSNVANTLNALAQQVPADDKKMSAFKAQVEDVLDRVGEAYRDTIKQFLNAQPALSVDFTPI